MAGGRETVAQVVEARLVVDCRMNPEGSAGHDKIVFALNRIVVICGGATTVSITGMLVAVPTALAMITL